MSTRTITGLSSRTAKAEVVRLLFGSKYAEKGPQAHRMLDPTIYSYDDLKKNYLERLQAIHPDKFKHTPNNHRDFPDNEMKLQFVDLQNAWAKYEKVARMMKKVGKGEAANFTRFGVGCSFSDTPEERAQRDEIMDQAGRGWFSAGALSETSEMNAACVPPPSALMDTDWFIDVTTIPPTLETNMDATQIDNAAAKITLIPGYRPKVTR
jgi:hypothetical protein